MKKFISIAMALTLVFALAACGSQQAPVPEETQSVSDQIQQTQTFRGTLDDKKDFMITVSDNQGNAYVFTLDGVAVPAEVGQTVVVTYTGDMDDFDAQLIATKVELS